MFLKLELSSCASKAKSSACSHIALMLLVINVAFWAFIAFLSYVFSVQSGSFSLVVN